MSVYRVFIKVMWADKELLNTYYLVSAANHREARRRTRALAREEVSPGPKAKLQIRTSFKRFIK